MSTRFRCLSTRTVTNVTRARETETTIEASSYLVTHFRFARASDTGDNSPRGLLRTRHDRPLSSPAFRHSIKNSCHICHLSPRTNETIMPLYTITAADLEQYFLSFAHKLPHAPGVAHLAELARTTEAIPRSLLDDLTAKMARLFPNVVAWRMSVRAREIAFDGLRYDDAIDFARLLDAELQGYLDNPEALAAALAELVERYRGTIHGGMLVWAARAKGPIRGPRRCGSRPRAMHKQG
jgi:hypothetical protein